MDHSDPSQPKHPNFESPYLLLKNSNENFHTLAKHIYEYINSHPFEDVVEVKEEYGSQVHKMRLNKEVPNQIRLLTRDIIKDLRDSLDHVMHSSALTLGSEKPDRAEFIFSNNEDSYKTDIRKNRGNPAQLNPVLEKIAAHKDGNQVLYGLSKIRNSDTHRKIVAVGSVPKNTTHVITSAIGGRPISHWDFEKKEYLYFVAPKGAEGIHHVTIELDLIFKDTEYFNSESVINAIGTMATHVEAVVRGIEMETLEILQEL